MLSHGIVLALVKYWVRRFWTFEHVNARLLLTCALQSVASIVMMTFSPDYGLRNEPKTFDVFS